MRWKEEAEIAAVALLVAICAGSLLIITAGGSPVRVWAALLAGTLGDGYGVSQTLFRATPLILTGLAVAVALRVGLFNIGVEGQLLAAMCACAVVGARLPAGTPGVVAVVVCAVAAMATGGALGFVTGALRAYRGAHEVITSIMLNAIAAGVVLWLGDRQLFVGGTTRTADVIASARLPALGASGSSLSVAIVIALAVTAAVAWLLARTRVGFEWRAVGASPRAAAIAGIDVRRALVAGMTASGAIAGLAAVHYVLGYKHAYEDGLGRGTGFMGIAVALVGRGHPGGVIAGALLLGMLAQGGLEISDQVPRTLVLVLQGVIVLAVAAAAPLVARRRAA